MTAMRQVLIYQDESGGWCAECPSLPGCNSQGEDREDAIRNIKEAIELYVESLQLDGQPIPPDTLSAVLVVV
jgi:predicted RNase H-like HicB family nuclease